MRRPKIRGNQIIPKPVNRYNNRRAERIRPTQEAYYCNNRNYFNCYNYLLSVTDNDPAVDQLFNLLDSNVKYNAVKSGNVDIEELIDGDDSTMGVFCGGSECGNFYGLGSCGGVCCGVGGLGIGCNFKIKDRRENREY
tara:strand:+ start:933 stop:1346 length:414 start_codon:yes stop_codon:yes gene_type:complete